MIIFQNLVNVLYIALAFSVLGILCPVEWLQCIIVCQNQVSFFKAPEGTELISCPYFLPVSQPFLNISKCRMMSLGRINPRYTNVHTLICSLPYSLSICLCHASNCAKFWVYHSEWRVHGMMGSELACINPEVVRTVFLKIKTFFFNYNPQ